jgi:hypothetical protein
MPPATNDNVAAIDEVLEEELLLDGDELELELLALDELTALEELDELVGDGVEPPPPPPPPHAASSDEKIIDAIQGDRVQRVIGMSVIRANISGVGEQSMISTFNEKRSH